MPFMQFLSKRVCAYLSYSLKLYAPNMCYDAPLSIKFIILDRSLSYAKVNHSRLFLFYLVKINLPLSTSNITK